MKVCGIRTPEGAQACASAGVDFVGLNFVPGVRRAIAREEARDLLPLLGVARPVAVFRDAEPAEVEDLAGELGIGWVQLHGVESPADWAPIAGAGPRVVKAVGATTDAALLKEYARHAAVLLVDGKEPGSGRVWTWRDLDRLRQSCGDRRPGQIAGCPFWVAGGLDPENVAAAIGVLRPSGVDAASGVERDGRTDEARIAAFCRAARAARDRVDGPGTGGGT